MWHPWRALRHQPQLTLAWQARPGLLGTYAAGLITLHPLMTQAERRSTIAHELVHAERGVVAGDRRAIDREERVVDDIAARRLIPLEELVDKLLWTMDENELAEELWVDAATVRARLAGLTPDEKTEIEQRIRRAEEGIQWD